METETKIRRLYFVDELTIKAICKKLHISRNTVRRVIRADAAGATYKRSQRNKPKLAPFVEQLEQWLAEDENLIRRKDRRTAMQYYTQLKGLGYSGAYDSVQRYVKAWPGKKRRAQQAYIPLEFEDGEAYQFDWSEEYVILGGVTMKVYAAHFRLCSSRQFFVASYPRQTQEMFFDAHNKAFKFFGGVTRRGIYDNLKTAINKIIRGKDRNYNKRFLALMDHYLIEPVACSPGAGWEKGQVEKQVDSVRNWLFNPRLEFADFNELNAYLAERCKALTNEKMHPCDGAMSIAMMFEKEKSQLRKTNDSFDSYHHQAANVNSMCLINFDNNKYSVPCQYANTLITLHCYVDRIVMLTGTQKICEHQRVFSRNKMVLDPWHYLPLLERKPGALRNGLPFKDWELPPSILTVKDALMPKLGGDRQVVKILMAMQSHGVEAVGVACELAITDKVISGEYILNILSRLNETSRPDNIEAPAHLALNNPPIADCSHYDQLLGESR